MKKNIIKLLIASSAFSLTLNLSGCSSNDEDLSKVNKNDIEKVSVYPLLADYKRNEISADNKYGGKVLELTGYITDITTTFGDLTLSIGSTPDEYSFNNINAFLNKSENKKMANLVKYSIITVICRNDKTATMSIPVLRSCIIK